MHKYIKQKSFLSIKTLKLFFTYLPTAKSQDRRTANIDIFKDEAYEFIFFMEFLFLPHLTDLSLFSTGKDKQHKTCDFTVRNLVMRQILLWNSTHYVKHLHVNYNVLQWNLKSLSIVFTKCHFVNKYLTIC